MKKTLFSIFYFLVSFSLLQTANGQTYTVTNLTNPLGAETFSELLTKIIENLQTYIVPPIVVGMILIGAFQMLFASGDPQKFSRGRNTILYTVIGYMVVLVASGISGIITDVTGAAVQVQTFANRLLGILQTFFWIIAAIMIMITAYRFLMAGGSEETLKNAKKQLTYTIIAIVIALISTAAVAVIRTFVNG